jgi:hypothetical protein
LVASTVVKKAVSTVGWLAAYLVASRASKKAAMKVAPKGGLMVACSDGYSAAWLVPLTVAKKAA